MSHGDALQAPPDGGELSELRGGSAAESDAMPSVRAEERGAGAAAVAPAPFRIGDRVEIHGEVIYVSAEGTREPWIAVRVDGERKHVVHVHQSDTDRLSDPGGPK